MSGLKPCPFCGGEAEVIEADECGPNAYVAQCANGICMASSKVVFPEKEDHYRLLADAWNRRSDSQLTRLKAYAARKQHCAENPEYPMTKAELRQALQEAVTALNQIATGKAAQ